MQLVSGVGKQKEEVRTEASSSSGVQSARLQEVRKYTALLPQKYQEAQNAGKRSVLQNQFQQGLQQSQPSGTTRGTAISPTAFVNQTLGQTEQQKREQRIQLAREKGELARQMQEDPTQYQQTMAQKKTMEAVTKLREAQQKVEAVQAKEQELTTRQAGLEGSYTALQGLLEQYQKTGRDVDAKAYLLAAQQYEDQRTRFNADLEQYQKDTSAYDQYNSAWEQAQKAQTAYEKAKTDYLDAHPAEKYQDANILEIYGVMQGLRAEIDADYEKAYANGTYKKWEELNALYKQKAMEQDNGLWDSGPVEFIDRAFTATQAGLHDWLAGMENLGNKAENAMMRIAATTLGNVADMIGSESLREKSEELLSRSKSTSKDAEAEQAFSRSLMQEALTGTGEIDGWIIQQMESVGAMWMDAFAAGASGAMGLMEGATSLQIMGTRAAGSAMLDAQEKGYSEMEQLMVGAAVGGLEVISEKLFGGNPLYDTDKGLVNRLVEKVTKNPTILRLMYSKGFNLMGEGLEEVFTEFLDPVAEWMLTDSADVDWASPEEVGQAFAGGVFLGLVGQGTEVAVETVANSGVRKAYRQLGTQMVQADAVQEVIAEGLAADQSRDAYQNAVNLQKKLDAGKEVTVREVGKQLLANQEAIEAGLLVDQEVEPVQDAPEGALKDPEAGFYAIQIEAGEDGKQTFRLVEVAPDGSISYQSETATTSLFEAKMAAEIQGLNIRQIGTSTSLRAAVEEKSESADRSTQEPEVAENAVEVQAENEEERIATAPAEPRNDIAGQELQTEPEGIQWAGNMPESLNGGIENGTEQQTAEQQTVGDSGNQERVRGNAAGQTARSPRQQYARAALRRAEEARRIQANVQAVGGELVSLREQGLSTGSADRTVRLVPKEAWTEEILDAAEVAESEGLEFIPLSGAMYVNYGKGEARINGAVEDGKVFIQTDSTKMSAREITMHEVFHGRAAKDPTLVPRLVELIQEKYTQEQTEEMFQRYYDAYQEIYSGRASDEALEEMIWEEMLADAYAEFQRFLDADASQFGMDVQEAVWSNQQSSKRGESSTERFSYDDSSMTHDATFFSYSYLTSQPDMKTVMLPEMTEIRSENGRVNTSMVLEEGMKNARAVGAERDGKVYVQNIYTGREVRIDKQSIRHGLNGSENRILTNARLGAVIGDVVQNAIPVNAMEDKAAGISGTYAMAGYAADSRGREFVAIVTVEQRSGDVSGLEMYDVAHAVSGRQKRNGSQADTKSQGVYPIKAATISIADFLDIVKQTHQSILSDDVLQELGEKRNTQGDYAGRVRFSMEGHEDDLQDILDQGIRQAATMESVREMDGTEFAKGEKNLRDQVTEYFSSIGNRAVNPVLGEVILDKRGVKDDIAHGLGRKKAITFMAVPDVIEKGGLIDYQENWKGRGYDTAALAAPVTIAGEEYMMGVILNRYSGENQFYVHEVLAESEEGAAPFKTGTIKDGAPGGDTPSVLSLLQKVMNVKRGNVRFSLETKQTKEDKARARAERELAKGLGEIMSMPQSAVRELQDGIVRQIMEEYQRTGEIDREMLDTAISEAFAKGLMIDDEFYQQYKPVKDYLRSQAVTISEQDRADIADFTDFRKRAFGTLRIVNNGGLPVDTAYQELQGMAPELFPMDITHPSDQLVHMYEVCKEIKKVQTPLERAMGENADEFYTWAEKKMNDLVEQTLEKYAKSVDWKPKEQKPKEQKQQKISQAALERFEQAEREEVPVLQWAGQETMEGFALQEQQTETTQEAPQTLEQAANGTMQEWIQYVLSGKMTPEEFAEMNRNAKSKELTGRAKEEAEKILNGHSILNSVKRDEMTDEEVAALIRQFEANRENAEDRNAQTATPVDELIIRKADFTGTPAMEKLGIKIDGSVARYRQTRQLKEYEEAAYGASKMLNKRIRQLKATEQEKELARLVVEGIITADALDSRTVDIETVAELADYYMAANSFKLDMIAQRRAEINTMNYRIASDLFRDSDAYSPQLPGVLKGMTKLVMNERTPERVVKQIFGPEHGTKIYETYFRPVWVNGAEMSRFESRMLDRVREFQDKDGKKRALTAQEREFAQRLMEGQAAKDAVESLEEYSKEKVTAVAQNLNNGAEFTDQIREWGMVGDEYLQGLAQAYADYLDTVTMSKDMDQTILQNAIETYSQIYNELYEAVNDFLTSHGYKPIGFIKGYAPHFQKREVQQGLFGALKSLGVEKESVSELPASIAGRTADFKPNMKWNPHFQSRKGEKTSYDIEAGYEQYIHYVAEMFYHTDDVMRIRQAVNYFRQAYSSEDISQAIEDAKVDQFKDVAWKKDFLEQKELLRPGVSLDDRAVNAVYEQYVSGLFDQAKPENLRKYSEFVTWMDNYANIVAGKQSIGDRSIESDYGRTFLNIGNWLMKRFTQANVAGNLSSVLNQTAQVPLIQQQLGKYMERAMWDMARGTTAKENFAERSDFLTDKRGVEKLTTDNAEKFISTLFKPAEMMDRMVSTLAVRGRYLQALDQGMTMEQAMKEADDFGRRVMGSRMKGAKPVGYEDKRLFRRMIHVFQVEASNTFDYMALSDMPQAVRQVYKTKGKAAGARYLASYIVGYLLNAFLLNQLTDKLYGGTPAPFDLMGWALNFVAGGWGLTDEEFLKTVTDNGLESIMGERPFGTEPIDSESGFSWAGSLSDLGYNVSNDMPYVRNVAGVLGLGDQSLPTVGINEFFKSLRDAGSAVWDKAFKGQEETGLTWAGTMERVVEDLLEAGAQIAPGGRQLKKTAQGVKTMVQGGVTSGYGDNQRLKYPVEQNVWNWARGLLFGNIALDEYDAYYASGNQPLTAGQTQKVKELEGLGIDRNISYELYQEFREINNDMTGVEASTAKRNAINDLDLTDDQKLEVFDRFFLDHTADNYEETRAEYQAMLDAGLTWNDVTLAHNEYAELQADEDMKATEKATALAQWADQQGWNEAQIEAVKERYRFYSMMPAEATNYEKFTGAGLQGDSSAKLTEILAGLTPEDGRETVSTNQKILAIQGSDLTDDEKAQAIVAMVPERRERLVEAGVSDETARDLAAAFAVAEAENGDEELSFMEKARTAVDMAKNNDEAMAALSTILQESTYGKLETAAAYGVTARAWVEYREAWTAAYGSDSVSQEKVEIILDRMNLNDRQKAALWQIANKSWKPANNPYSVSVGEDIFDMLNEE